MIELTIADKMAIRILSKRQRVRFRGGEIAVPYRSAKSNKEIADFLNIGLYAVEKFKLHEKYNLP